MKFFLSLLVASLALHSVLAKPALPSDDAEVIDVPRRRLPSRIDSSDTDADPDFNDFKGVIDTGVGYPFLQPDPHPFSFNLGFFDSFDDIFRRLRARLWPADLPGIGVRGGDGDSGEGSFFNLSDKKGNTTSTVEIVNGHKVEVNETVYGDENNLFKVRVVNIRPVDSDEDVDVIPTPTPNNQAPTTSGPGAAGKNGDDDESDERREPLAKRLNENEIGNIDEPETSTRGIRESSEESTTMSPSVAEHLNAEFVADNGADNEGSASENGNGNIEAETNTADERSAATDNDDEEDNDEGVALAAEQPQAALSNGATDSRLTIENNEETEVNDNFNESSEVVGVGVAGDNENDEDITELPLTSEAEQLRAELTEDDEDDEDPLDDAEMVDGAGAGAGAGGLTQAEHSNYAAAQREDAVSSDDEEERDESTEMHPTFNSEWANIVEDLAIINDKNNDLNNDIDVYDSVPVDLSNDIAVNDVAAAQPDFPHNPDAELIEAIDAVDRPANSSMPKFERLSIAAAMQPTSYQPTANAPATVK